MAFWGEALCLDLLLRLVGEPDEGEGKVVEHERRGLDTRCKGVAADLSAALGNCRMKGRDSQVGGSIAF